MKQTALATLLAGALLCAGCSDSTEVTVAATPKPEPTLTAEQIKAKREALNKKRVANGLPPNELTTAPSATPTP